MFIVLLILSLITYSSSAVTEVAVDLKASQSVNTGSNVAFKITVTVSGNAAAGSEGTDKVTIKAIAGLLLVKSDDSNTNSTVTCTVSTDTEVVRGTPKDFDCTAKSLTTAATYKLAGDKTDFQLTDDKNAKIKGGIYYYKDKNNDYNQIIEAQKNWINNLPEKNDINNNFQLSNSSLGKTYQINDQINNNQNKYNNLFGNELKNDFNSNNNNRKTSSFNYNPIENNINNEQNNFKRELPNNNNNNNYLSENQNNDKNKSKLCFDPKRNNNKGYIIKKGEKINNSDNEEENIIKNNYNTDPNINDEKSKINPINSINLNNNFNYKSFPQNENINDKNDNNAENKKDEEENNNINNLNNNDNINQDEEINPLTDRYLIVDKDGNPILINGQKLLAMALIPLIGEDGKETIDENGNIRINMN